MAYDETKTIYTDDGSIKIPYYEINTENVIDRTSFIFGGTKSGKTTIVLSMLHAIKDYIPNFLVIVPETSAHFYNRLLPKRCIKSDMSKSLLKKLWKRQVDLTQCCNIAKDIKILKRLFQKINDRQSAIMIEAIQVATDSTIAKLKNRHDLDYAQKRDQESDIVQKRDDKIRFLLKRSIREHRKQLMELDLTVEENIALDYLDVNPRIAIIVDDCTENIPIWMKYFKKKDNEINIFESIIYRGRHNGFTFICVSHNDKAITCDLRRGARNVIFTQSQALVASLNKPQSGYTNQEKKDAMKIARRLFGDDTTQTKSFQKLCYIREDNIPFQYTIADIHPDFTLGCPALVELNEKMPKKESKLEDNQFMKELVNKKKKYR